MSSCRYDCVASTPASGCSPSFYSPTTTTICDVTSLHDLLADHDDVFENLFDNICDETSQFLDSTRELDELTFSDFRSCYDVASPNDVVSTTNNFRSTNGRGDERSATKGSATKFTTTSSTVSFLSSPSVPSNTAYSGHYGFEVSVKKQLKETKSAMWTYSESGRKLYIRPFVQCPITFRSHRSPPEGSVVRVLPVYVRPEHVQEVVRRCPNHQTARPLEETSNSVSHLVLSNDSGAIYVEDRFTGRLSVVFSHEQSSKTDEWSTRSFQFMCYSSCVGGLNRRPLQLIFTLENQEGTVLGRQSFEVRICACPGRDRRGDERPPAAARTGVKATVGGKVMSHSSAKRALFAEDSGHSVRERASSVLKASEAVSLGLDGIEQDGGGDDDGIFKLRVRGRESYEVLRKLRDCLEIPLLLPPQHLQQYRAKRHQLEEQEVPAAATSTGQASTTTTATKQKSEFHNKNGQLPLLQQKDQKAEETRLKPVAPSKKNNHHPQPMAVVKMEYTSPYCQIAPPVIDHHQMATSSQYNRRF